MPLDLGELKGTVLNALDHAGIGMTVVVEHDGRIEHVFVSESAARIFGTSRDEAENGDPLDHLSPVDRTKLELRKKELRGGQLDGGPLRGEVLTPGGLRVPVNLTVALAELSGRPATVTFIRDVSEHVTIEQRLRTSELRFRTFTEAAPDGICVVEGGRLLYLNPVAKRLFGGAESGAEVGAHLASLIHQDDVPVMRERMEQILTGEVLRPQEYRVIHPNGEKLSVEISSIPFEYDNRPCLLAFGRDVTERKRMQARLIQADRMATVGTLATGVAHEINNPLTYVVLHLEKLRRSLTHLVPSEEGRKDAEHMLAEALDGAERVRVIVQDLLSLARSDTSTHSPVDVRKVVETALKLASPVLDGRATIVRELEETAPVRANAAWLGQVFVNLLVNAGQAFETDRPTANRVRVATQTVPTGQIEVVIEDNGPGIPSEVLDRIFDPFFTTKEAGVGTGLGLAISRSVVDSLGGELDVSSHPGKGTTFSVRLPPLSETGLMGRQPRSIRAAVEDGLRTGEFPAIDNDYDP